MSFVERDPARTCVGTNRSYKYAVLVADKLRTEYLIRVFTAQIIILLGEHFIFGGKDHCQQHHTADKYKYFLVKIMSSCSPDIEEYLIGVLARDQILFTCIKCTMWTAAILC